MPTTTDLTWEPATFRWKKVGKGKADACFCRALGLPWTKFESYQAADEWWKAKKAELDASFPLCPHDLDLVLLAR